MSNCHHSPFSTQSHHQKNKHYIISQSLFSYSQQLYTSLFIIHINYVLLSIMCDNDLRAVASVKAHWSGSRLRLSMPGFGTTSQEHRPEIGHPWRLYSVRKSIRRSPNFLETSIFGTIKAIF